jgi:hypothetical protein
MEKQKQWFSAVKGWRESDGIWNRGGVCTWADEQTVRFIGGLGKL